MKHKKILEIQKASNKNKDRMTDIKRGGKKTPDSAQNCKHHLGVQIYFIIF